MAVSIGSLIDQARSWIGASHNDDKSARLKVVFGLTRQGNSARRKCREKHFDGTRMSLVVSCYQTQSTAFPKRFREYYGRSAYSPARNRIEKFSYVLGELFA